MGRLAAWKVESEVKGRLKSGEWSAESVERGVWRRGGVQGGLESEEWRTEWRES